MWRRRHPARRELLAYAEGLVALRVAFPAATAAHVEGCPRCRAEVRAIRRSLGFVAEAPALEPGPEFTARVLLAVQNERQLQKRRRGRLAKAAGAFRAAACAAVVLGATAVSFGTALHAAPATGRHAAADARPDAAAVAEPASAASPEAVHKALQEIRTLATALQRPAGAAPSLWERAQRRVVGSLEADIAAATAALERNPGCLRASALVHTDLQRQAQALKALYAERSL